VKRFVLLMALSLASCGYHVAGHTNLLPKTLQTVCIRLPEALSKELISRTRYRIVTDCGAADAALRGSVNNYLYFPTVTDPSTGRASAVDVRVYMSVNLTERATNKVLFTRPSMEVRERYEISIDPRAYFDESDAALDRVARTVAQQLITAILENF
jgi:Lipopolysaccharide-assembly